MFQYNFYRAVGLIILGFFIISVVITSYIVRESALIEFKQELLRGGFKCQKLNR